MLSRKALLPVVVVLAAGLCSVPAVAAGEAGAGNGYVLMVHGWFEPYPEGQPHALGPAMAVRDGEHVTFSAIPYSVATGRPVVVGDAMLEIASHDGTDARPYRPNVAFDNPVCRRETGFEGHEGPLEACLNFRMPASDFGGRNVVVATLHFTDDTGAHQMEPYSVTNHTLLHGYLQAGVPEDVSAADRSGGHEPFLVEDQADPLP